MLSAFRQFEGWFNIKYITSVFYYRNMARNLGHWTLYELHPVWHAMVLTAGLHRDFRVTMYRAVRESFRYSRLLTGSQWTIWTFPLSKKGCIKCAGVSWIFSHVSLSLHWDCCLALFKHTEFEDRNISQFHITWQLRHDLFISALSRIDSFYESAPRGCFGGLSFS